MANLSYARGRWMNLDKPGGAVFFVSGGTASYPGGLGASNVYKGLTPEEPFSTIQKGLDQCVSGRGDTVVITPGSITVTAALTMDSDDVTLAASQPSSPNSRSASVIVNATDVNTVEVNANNVVIDGIEFDDNVATATADTAVIACNTASSATDYVGFKVINCFLDMLGSDSDRDGIALGLTADATDGAIGALVEGTTILDCDQDAIVINVGSEFSVVRNCVITESANLTRYGVEVLAVRCRVEDCIIEVGLSAGACVHNGVAAARLIVTGCHLSAIGADTIALAAIATATGRSSGNWLTALAAGNLNDYVTDNTTPSADCNLSGIFAATPGVSAFDNVSVDGS